MSLLAKARAIATNNGARKGGIGNSEYHNNIGSGAREGISNSSSITTTMLTTSIIGVLATVTVALLASTAVSDNAKIQEGRL